MKKKRWITAGIAAMLLAGMPGTDADADIIVHVRTAGRPEFVINSWPGFIFVPKLGYSVSKDNAYDIIRYNKYYYIYKNGYWYRSPSYRSQWVIVKEHRLPYKIRKYRRAEIRKHRDIEFREKYGNRWEKENRHQFEDKRGNGRYDDGNTWQKNGKGR
ncbi:MAG: hypothetical protein FJZ79_02390 [Chlorobi bacterium]|nr:hypothetical protein [Chlorobiota bacterium]